MENLIFSLNATIPIFLNDVTWNVIQKIWGGWMKSLQQR